MNTRVMLQDDGQHQYECGPRTCGYTGKTYCQNCGFAKEQRQPGGDWYVEAFGVVR
jgi:hypothetical protein